MNDTKSAKRFEGGTSLLRAGISPARSVYAMSGLSSVPFVGAHDRTSVTREALENPSQQGRNAGATVGGHRFCKSLTPWPVA
jgi:hypothetical protein